MAERESAKWLAQVQSDLEAAEQYRSVASSVIEFDAAFGDVLAKVSFQGLIS